MESTLNPTRSTSFVIDSRDRDLTRFPLPSHYEISLDEAVHDVIRMRLLVADVPFASYLIQSTNNSIQAVIPGTTTTPTVINATIPVGDYLGHTLAAAVQAALQANTSTGQYQFTAEYSTLTDNIIVTCTLEFSLVFAPAGSAALELGFAVGTTNYAVPSSPTSFVATPPFRRNSNLNPSLVLSIIPACVNTSINEHVNQSFAILTPNRSALSAAGEALSQKSFHPPIARFSRFTVDFSNYDGTPVDFQNHDHRIEILLTSLRAAKYMHFDGLPTVP